MRPAPLLAAALLLAVPAAALAQGMDMPGAAAPPAQAPAPSAAPEGAPPAVAPAGALPPPAPGEPTAVAPPPVEGAPAPGSPAAKPQKSGAYFGFSLGTGKGTMTAGGTSIDIDKALSVSGSSPTTMNFQLRSGWGSGDFLFGLQLNYTRTWIDVAGTSAGLDFMAFDMVGTWWDQQMGIYFRAGLGPSSVNSFVGNNTSQSVSGVELMAGFGVTMGGLGVGIDVFHQTYDRAKAGFDTVNYTIAAISFDMY